MRACCACSRSAEVNQDPANTETSDETLYLGFGAEPSTLWGAAGGKLENEDVTISGVLMDTLVRNNPETNEVEPNLASSWEWLDGTHCRFTLRDDVTMTDGTPLVADDVVYTIGVWNERSAATTVGQYIVGAETEDEHTVVIEFTVQAPDLLVMMGWYEFGIVSEDEVEAAGGLDAVQRNPVIGSGRYRFKSWEPGVSITLERNEEYWNPDYKGYYKEIVIRFINDPAARGLSVEAGELNVACDIPLINGTAFVDKENVKTYIYPTGNVLHLWYNMGENASATKDLKVRQAIDKALNFDAITQVATMGYAQPALGYAEPESKYYTQTLTEEERAVDVEGAEALLAETGYEGGLELKLLCLQDFVPAATVIQENLAEVGITLQIDTPDTAKFVEDAFAGNYDLIPVGETLVTRAPNIMPFLVKANIEGPGVVIGGPKWTTDEIDAAIAELVAEQDEEKAKEEVKALDETMKENMVCSNLYPEMKSAVTSPDLKGYTSVGRGYIDLGTFYK